MVRMFVIAAFAWSATTALAADKVDFAKDVWPILHDKCVSCHRAPYKKGTRVKKPKGDLRIDTKELFLKGGEDGKVVVPGKPDDSTIYTLTLLDEDHDDVMPPKGDLLTDKEKATLKNWILQGADFGTWTEGKYVEKEK